jgi:hypothetical protein
MPPLRQSKSASPTLKSHSNPKMLLKSPTLPHGLSPPSNRFPASYLFFGSLTISHIKPYASAILPSAARCMEEDKEGEERWDSRVECVTEGEVSQREKRWRARVRVGGWVGGRRERGS